MTPKTPSDWLSRKWCPYCHTPLTLVRAVTLKNDCTKYVCLSCHESYSELKRRCDNALAS